MRISSLTYPNYFRAQNDKFYCLDSVPESEPAPGNQTFPKNMAAPRDLTFSLSIRSKMRKGRTLQCCGNFFPFPVGFGCRCKRGIENNLLTLADQNKSCRQKKIGCKHLFFRIFFIGDRLRNTSLNISADNSES